MLGALCVSVGFIGLGLLMIFGRDQENKQKISDGTATIVARLAQVEQYGTPLATLQNVEAGTMRRISASALGLDSKGIIYGHHEDDSFYAYIYDPEYNHSVLGYFSKSSPYSCRLDGVAVSGVSKIGTGWYAFFSLDSADTIMTSVAHTTELKTPENILKTFAPSPIPTATPTSTATVESTPEATP